MMAFVWILAITLLLLFAAIVRGFFVPLYVHYIQTPGENDPVQPELLAEADHHDAPFVGLALSGGGTRAALFAAAGMEALAERGILQQVTHISSVSGGGFAACYLALHPLPAADRGQRASYFSQMYDILAHNYFKDIQINQIKTPLRLFTPSRRMISLQDALDRPGFLNGATFASLPTDRVFYLNAVSYDTGRRFVFSNGCLPAPDSMATFPLPRSVRALSFSTRTALRATPSDMPLSLAVATSAGFPPYLGPTTLQMCKGATIPPEFWHLGDGGVLENSGVETLREAVYARNTKQPALIYSFNAGQRVDQNLSKNTLDISIWSRDVARIVDVLLEYSGALRDTMYRELDDKSATRIDLVEFDYLDVAKIVTSGAAVEAKWTSWDAWPDCTPAHRLLSETPADHLAKIPTALKISACDRALITHAARFLVHYKLSVSETL